MVVDPQPFLLKDADRQEIFEPTTEGVARREQTAPPAKSGPGERNRTADTGIFSSYVYIKIIDFKYFIYIV